MNSRVTALWQVRCLVLAVSAAVSSGCARGLSAPLASSPAPPGFPTDTTQYNALLAQYPLSGPAHVRKRCAKGLFCSKIDVSIQARGTTSSISPENGPASPVPVAHLVNLDKSKIERYYKLLPGDGVDYNLWVNRKPASNHVEWRIVGRDKITNEFVYGEATDLTYCHKYPLVEGATDADFADDVINRLGPCTEPPGTTHLSIKQSSLGLTQLFSWLHIVQEWVLTYSRTGGGWIECSNGCCT